MGSGGEPAYRTRLARAGRHGHPDGLAAHRAIEDATDLAAARPWAQLGTAATEQLISVLGPIAQACAAELPYPNPVGVPAPAASADPSR